MPTKGTSMRKLTQILRLHFEANLTNRQIARSLNLSPSVVNKYVNKAKGCGLSWPLADDMDEQKLSSILLPAQGSNKSKIAKGSLDFTKIHQELKIKGVTLYLLWEEYKDQDSTLWSYSRFCFHYREYKQTLRRSMRQNHKAGDKAFIDYSGATFNIIDPDTNEIRAAEIFVGVLGASNYTFAEATWSQTLPDFIASQRRMFEFFGGVTALIVPDNLKSAVSKTCRYDPDINPAYAQFVEHYGTAVLPARPYKPKDKPKAEGGVLLVQRWILAKLRHETFVGLAELNAAIIKILITLNKKPFQKMDGSRESVFIELEKPALRPLPKLAYDYRQYKKAKAGIDYHVNLEGHYYSVPHLHCGKQIDLWFNQYTVKCYLYGNIIATHLHSKVKGLHTTIGHHMPVGHRKQSQYSKERFITWAGKIGSYTQAIVRRIMESKSHPEQGYRACLGLLSLTKKYDDERLENACHYAWNKGVHGRKSVISILENKLDQLPDPIDFIKDSGRTTVHHENIRGALYYH